MSDHCPTKGCPWTADRPRHVHPCNDLRQIGETCRYCNANAWMILFGGPLPARIQCQPCGAGFNITQRLREATTARPVSVVDR